MSYTIVRSKAAQSKIQFKGMGKMEAKYSLYEIMTMIEAADKYHVNYNTLKNKFKPSVTKPEKIQAWIQAGLIRQSGKTWLITEKFMQDNFKKVEN